MRNIILSIVIVFSLSLSGQTEDFQSYETDYFTLYSKNPVYNQRVTNSIINTRNRLIEILKDSLEYKPKIYLIEEQGEFDKLVEGSFPDWGAAAALPYEGKIVIKSPDHFNVNRTLDELLAHEYAHLVITDKCGLYEPPRWLNEGVAMYISTEWSWSDNLNMSKSAVFGQFIELEEINKLNRFNEGKAQLAYSQSYLLIEYLVSSYSPQILERITSRIASGENINEAILESTGLTLKQFEGGYKRYLNQRFNVASLFVDTIFFWMFLTIVMIIGFYRNFKKRRAYYKKWDEEEQYRSTDFDYGDPDNPEAIDDDEPWKS